MREILFRAKRIDNSDWVEGLLIVMWGEYHIINPNNENTAYLIILETTGQFTGLLDKNGNKIFEGDIVAINTPNNYGNINGFTGIVVFHDCGFELQNIEDEDCYECMWYENEKLEVVGNIYDNPELIGGLKQ